MEIKKIREYKNGQKVVIVPKKSDLKAGDYVKITKLNLEESKDE